MNLARRLLVVSSDHRDSQLVQTHIHKTFLLTAPVVRFDDVPSLLSRETDGLLILLASESDDAERIEALIRDLRIQDFPPRLAVLEMPEFRSTRSLDSVSPYHDGHWSWSHHTKELNNWIRKSLHEGLPFLDSASETRLERLKRRLTAQTPSLAPLFEQLAIAAEHDVTVLIEGETGTGKTHLARLIHESSPRAEHKLHAVSCGAMSGLPLASELFGHVRGAFAGADAMKVGKFAAAGHGTILLDEIDSLGLDQQANVLRVLETGEFEPLGSSETQYNQSRIIATANGNLAEAVDRGTFRRDLYYRLHVIAFPLPALRDRVQDIGPLSRSMASRYGTRFHKPLFGIGSDAMRALESFPWPGNIRQLENVIQQAVLSTTGADLRLHHLPAMVHTRQGSESGSPLTSSHNSLAQNRETTERSVIVRALEKSGFSRTRAAGLLGVSRVTLYKKMKKYGLLNKSSGSTVTIGEGFIRAVI
jgi:transcriptional regulator with PAS, ATPase and Fis domain